MATASRATLLWSAALLAASVLEARCAHTRYDHRASAREGCTILRGVPTACHVPELLCLDAAAVQFLSPRWLGVLSGSGGSLLTWIPLLVAAPTEARHASRCAIVATLIWYLSLIGAVRHAHVLTGGWDPSGHVFVFGSQLLPAWHLRSCWNDARLLVRAWLVAWSWALIYLSIATAAFFHTPSETAASWLLLGLLWRTLPHATTAAESEVDRAEDERRSAGGSGPRLPHARLCVCAALWLVATAVGWSDESGPSRNVLVGQLAYDGVLWLMLAWLLQPPAGCGAPEETDSCCVGYSTSRGTHQSAADWK